MQRPFPDVCLHIFISSKGLSLLETQKSSISCIALDFPILRVFFIIFRYPLSLRHSLCSLSDLSSEGFVFKLWVGFPTATLICSWLHLTLPCEFSTIYVIFFLVLHLPPQSGLCTFMYPFFFIPLTQNPLCYTDLHIHKRSFHNFRTTFSPWVLFLLQMLFYHVRVRATQDLEMIISI